MGNYEKISGTSTAIIALSTVIGVAGALAYYIFTIVTQSKTIILLILTTYIISMYCYAKSINKKLRWI